MTALCPILAVSVVDMEVEVSGVSVVCCSLLAIRSSACAVVEPMLEWSELSMVFVEIASKIQSTRFRPSTGRADLPMSAIFPVPRMMISRQCPTGQEISHFLERM